MLVCCHLCCVVYILLTVTVTVTFPVFHIYILIDCYQTIALRINKYSDSDSEFDFNLAE